MYFESVAHVIFFLRCDSISSSRVPSTWLHGIQLIVQNLTCAFTSNFLQVEQLHKIFKLCGSPPNQYWKLSKLPLATMFKPQHPYESTLRERCREFPKTAVSLIETFLSIEPYKRCSASIALESEVSLEVNAFQL